MKNKLIILAIISYALTSCSHTPAAPTPTAAAALTPTAVSEIDLSLGTYFQDQPGAFILYDLNLNRTIRYNPQRCSQRFIPASTFKIMNSLVGLESGVIPDENYVIKWNGVQTGMPGWDQDNTLKSAIQYSVVWYYQELARRVGRQKMQQYIDAVGYGNRDISGQIDTFWLEGNLRISADEQVEFLKQLYLNRLPLSQRTMDIVKSILVLEKTNLYRLSGKTGSGQRLTPHVGWFVGYLETNGNVYFFATNFESTNPDGVANGDTARKINWKILQRLKLVQ